MSSSSAAIISLIHCIDSRPCAYFMMNLTSNGHIKRRTALANRKAMPVAPSLIAMDAMHRHAKIPIAPVHASKRYSLSFRGLGISFSLAPGLIPEAVHSYLKIHFLPTELIVTYFMSKFCFFRGLPQGKRICYEHAGRRIWFEFLLSLH